MKRRILSYSLFEAGQPAAASELSLEQKEFLNECTRGTWTYNPATGLVDVVGDFDCSSQKLQDLKGIRFGHVSMDFFCKGNKLRSLEGAPREVGGDFLCSYNKLTSLKGAPQKVGRNYYCTTNKLTSLEGAPQEIRGNFVCYGNSLTSLNGGPRKVSGSFYCTNNKLTSLEGAPQEVGGELFCDQNEFTSLEGAPEEVGGKFSCDAFGLGEKEWNLEGFLKVQREGKRKAQRLIMTMLTPEFLNREIQKDPAGMIMNLKSVLNDPGFSEIRSKLVWPKGYEDEVDLVGGLDSLGF
jgi:hypothetical protein